MMTILPLTSGSTETAGASHADTRRDAHLGAHTRPGAQARRGAHGIAPRRGVRLEPTRLGQLLILTGAFLLGALVAALVLLTVIPQASAGEAPQTITVQQGQTLWGIAQEHAPEGTDLRAYVLEAQRINDLTTERVSAGQELELPQE